jgi:flagellar motor switch protein FliN/FliY
MSSDDMTGANSDSGALTQDQIDIIGEVCNISMGSAATALSNIMSQKVTITSPRVEMASEETISEIDKIPSVGVIISYTEGVIGKDILIIKRDDAKAIVKALMGEDIPGDEEFGELHISAVSEVMNQMMGSAATALAGFIGKSVNISPPVAFILTDENKSEKLSFIYDNISNIVFVRFRFNVENILESDLYMIMTREFTDELVTALLQNMGVVEMPKAKGENAQPQAMPPLQPPPAAPPRAQSPPPQPRPIQRDPEEQAQAQVAALRASVMQTSIRPAVLPDFGPEEVINTGDLSNFELIQEVPLELSVEVGRAKKLVREVMDFSVGTIIELDKQAGDPVDIIVSGQLIARGEVVVIDESFGVRVTEIMNRKNKGRV